MWIAPPSARTAGDHSALQSVGPPMPALVCCSGCAAAGSVVECVTFGPAGLCILAVQVAWELAAGVVHGLEGRFRCCGAVGGAGAMRCARSHGDLP